MSEYLKYKDEQDKSLGIAGMAITLVFNDKEHLLASVSMEDDEDALCMAEEFYFAGNPRLSAKITWKEMLSQLQVGMGLMFGNVMCRSYAAGANPSKEALQAIHDMIVSDAADYCSLDADEADTLYEQGYDYYRRMFAHPGVCTVARDFAGNLVRLRRMSSGEVIDNLRRLASIL